MTKKTRKIIRLDEKRPYNRKFRCQNPGCKGLTDCPAWNCGKLYCQKCTIYRKLNNTLPSKEVVDSLRKEGKWKK